MHDIIDCTSMEFEKPIPVSVFIQLLNTQLSELNAKIFGEICQLKQWSSGHVYFDLKDPTDESVISCVIWKHNYRLMGVELAEGMQIVATGKPNVYSRTGRLSFVADTVEYAGEGDLKKAYDALHAKLSSEGLFAPEKKRSLPKFIHKIGVITSKQGAVIHDFENNLGRFGFKLTFVDSRVEGKEAIKDLLNAVYTMRKQEIEALVIMRGGGSRASLAAFDSEALVRAIADFPVPVVAGIGHHEDVPLTVLAADVAVSTPTAAAHVFNTSWEELFYTLDSAQSRILSAYMQRILIVSTYLDSYTTGLSRIFERACREISQKLDSVEKIIRVNDPARQLRLGYSIVRANGKVVRSTKDVTIGDEVETQVADGVFTSNVSKQS